MSSVSSAAAHLVHALPGRARFHLPGWSGQGAHQLERRLRHLPGVRTAQANPYTGNVLIQYDPRQTDPRALAAALAAPEPDPRAAAEMVPSDADTPPVLQEKQGNLRRVRVVVRGLDRDHRLAHQIIRQMEHHPGVRARPNPLTGRVLLEFEEGRARLEDLLDELAGLELPALPGEDRPSHPLDPQPLREAVTRTAGAALGLGMHLFRRLAGIRQPLPAARTFATASGVITLLRGFPFIRFGFRRLMGHHHADLFFAGASIVSQTFSGGSLGLIVSGAEGMRLLTEVLARRSAWRRYEERVESLGAAEPGEVIRLQAGDRSPLRARVVEGTGTAIGRGARPKPVAPGAIVKAGSRLLGGPFLVELLGERPFHPLERRLNPAAPTLFTRYARTLGPVSLAYAALTAVLTRSFVRTFQALLLVNPRTAVVGMEMANLDASARVLRAGVTVVGTRPHHSIILPRYLLFDSPRLLTNGIELRSVLPLAGDWEAAEILALAAGMAAAVGSPWGRAFPPSGHAPVSEGRFDGRAATAVSGGVHYALGPVEDEAALPAASRLRGHGDYLLMLRDADAGRAIGLLVMRPRLAPGVAELVRTCRRYGVEVQMLPRGKADTAKAIAHRAQVTLLDGEDTEVLIRERQQAGARVAFVSDSSQATEAFAACDLGIGLATGRTSRYLAHADLLAPDLPAVTAIIEAGARREAAVRDSVALSALSNVFGMVWGLQGEPGLEEAMNLISVSALGAMGAGWAELRGGARPGVSLLYLVDPQPERWGRQDPASVLRAFSTAAQGLSTAEAARRRQHRPHQGRRHEWLSALLHQLQTPMTGILSGAALLSLLLGDVVDGAILLVTIGLNVAVGIWQEHQADQAAELLQRMGRATARVLRDGQVTIVPVSELVAGDILVLAPGDRVTADARLLEARGLEVDQATLTGESLPVHKWADGGPEESHVVLEGTDVLVGTGRAVVVAVGRQTRLGAMTAALAFDESRQSPLGIRLARLLRVSLPVAGAGGALVIGAGLLRGQPLRGLLPVGMSAALAAVPEGLPLLAGTGEAGVARRLTGRQAMVRRLSAIEALGRVDVACADKTGTMTQGRLTLRLLADVEQECELPGQFGPELLRLLRAAGLASPHPDSAGASAHPTDQAVIQGAHAAGLDTVLRAPRSAEAPFDPARPFHAAMVFDRLYVKGSPEALAPRCSAVRVRGSDRPLTEAGRDSLLERARHLAERGLRVLLVAEGPAQPPENPQGLTALGFVGISDPLRATVPPAVRRCQDAGVRVIMLTGDHPATARAIAREAGLLCDDGEQIVTASELAELENGELEERLERVCVVARATPLDKLRIIEALQRRGHTVAMTGDGANDAPALRLADVGVAMGRTGTEVARQAADLVLRDDDFATLVEALVEGRGFWRNMRRALGLLLGGNLGELGLITGVSALGLGPPLNSRQILVVNLITDALPALAVVLQRPEHRHLAGLAREGVAALDVSLRKDVLRRGLTTSLPTLGTYILARQAGGVGLANSTAFAGIVAAQLAQTLDAGRTDRTLDRSVTTAVGGSAAFLAATLAVPALRNALGLAALSPAGLGLVGLGALASVLFNRACLAAGVLNSEGNGVAALPVPAPVPALPPPATNGVALS